MPSALRGWRGQEPRPAEGRGASIACVVADAAHRCSLRRRLDAPPLPNIHAAERAHVDHVWRSTERSSTLCVRNRRPIAPEHILRLVTVSTESITSTSHHGVTETCVTCGAPLAADQRYCLECGERCTPMSSVLLGGPPASASTQPPAGATAPPQQPGSPSDGAWQRSNALTVIAGVGVLLLAMGVGVLIGRAGNSKSTAASPQVISVASTPSAGTTAAPSSSEASFTSSWPAGTTGYTVQLQTLPVSGTSVSAVEAAKTAATAKGATGVGALKSTGFSSLPPGNYVIYAGVDHTKAEAEKALASLKKSFPAASVIAVSNRASSSSSGGSSSGGGSGAGSSLSHPAPPTVVENLSKVKGKSYEEKSKNLPDVIETG